MDDLRNIKKPFIVNCIILNENYMIQLEEPEFGGATVFTKLNLKVNPVFRSAVFWYNLHRNQSLDTRLE